MTVTEINDPTWVYHAFCEHNGLLYVGVASDPERRVRQHLYAKPWWRHEVDMVLAELYPSRRQALDVESSAIHNMRPTYNLRGQAPPICLPHEKRPHEPLRGHLRLLDAHGLAV